MSEHSYSAEFLRECFVYDPATGDTRWRERPASHFSTPQARGAFNAKCAGAPAGRLSRGYRGITIRGRSYYLHRVVWCLVYGSWPDGQIDHINGVRDDNRIENLRVVTSAENHKNMALGTASTSGVAGVSWHERDARWRAHIKVGGRQKHLGNFRRFEDAVSARLTANAALGFSERHGMDARVSA